MNVFHARFKIIGDIKFANTYFPSPALLVRSLGVCDTHHIGIRSSKWVCKLLVIVTAVQGLDSSADDLKRLNIKYTQTVGRFTFL